MAAENAKKALKVTAPLVVATTESGRVIHLYRGDVVGDDIAKESVNNLKELGFVGTDTDVLPA